MSMATLIDLMVPMFQVQKEGNDETGYRLRARIPVAGEAGSFSFFAVKEDGHYYVRGFGEGNSVGYAALHFAGVNQLESGRIWLNWAREEVDAGGGDDPLKGSPFASIWPKAKATATADEIRLAAAVLMAEKTAGAEKDISEKKAIGVLEELYPQAPNDATKAAIDRALTFAYGRRKDWTKSVAPAQRLVERYPESEIAFLAYTQALSLSGKSADAETLAKQRLERLPKDRAALRALAVSASAKRDYEAAERYAQQIIDETAPEREDFNNAAWYGVFTGNLERAMENARQATGGEKRGKQTAPSFHTLAVIFAESGKTVEARQALFSSMEQRNHDQPDSNDWYVLGRIAETYGVREAALAAYKRVQPDNTDASVAELVERRMKGLK